MSEVKSNRAWRLECEALRAELAECRRDAELYRAQRNARNTLLLDAADFFGWFNRNYPEPSANPEHPWCVLGDRLTAYALARGEGE